MLFVVLLIYLCFNILYIIHGKYFQRQNRAEEKIVNNVTPEDAASRGSCWGVRANREKQQKNYVPSLRGLAPSKSGDRRCLPQHSGGGGGGGTNERLVAIFDR